MSYILDALKKAQAERQLGDVPTIHAPQLQGGGQAGVAGAALGQPLSLALGCMTLALAGLSVWMWRSPAPGAAAPRAEVAGVVPATAAALPPAAPAAPPAPAVSLPVPQVPAIPPAPAPVPATLATPPAPLKPKPLAAPKPAATATVASAAPAPSAAPRPEPVAVTATVAVPAPDEALPAMRELPEPIQRLIPAIALGGYIYSKNPADRLLLIDKVLRHEGEEVAPGLTLEKLQPKAAVFSFKGYRYRVPY